MPVADPTTAASRLCTACGMCCNGVLFHIVKVQPGDSVKALESLGLQVNRKKREPYFNQPCRALDGCTCTIYLGRPTRCRLFECGLLKRLADDEVTEPDAEAVIARTRGHVRQVERLLAGHGNASVHQPLIERCRQVLESLDPADAAAIKDEMQRLNDLLNRCFRLEPEPLDL